MVEATKKDRGHRAAHVEVRSPALRPVLLYYAIARHGDHGLRLLHVPLGFDEEALIVFSSWEAAQRYFLSDVFSGEWYTRECSVGELVCVLLGPYEGTKWVLSDPVPGCPAIGGSSADLMSRRRFVDHLLG
ncbi:MAG: hypothetical protein M3N18_01480 [Actinomycetota bacterium]|nr:hypothetical protein [Actinomycetota bacterium]